MQKIIELLFNELVKVEKEILILKEDAKVPSKHSNAYRDIASLKMYKKMLIELYDIIKAV